MEQSQAKKVKTAALEKLKTKGIDPSTMEVEEPPPGAAKQKVGIKEIKELILFVFALAELTVEVVGDGIGLMDILDVIRDDEVRKKFGPAVRGVDEIPAEVADLSTQEMKQIADLLWHEAWSLWESISS